MNTDSPHGYKKVRKSKELEGQWISKSGEVFICHNDSVFYSYCNQSHKLVLKKSMLAFRSAFLGDDEWHDVRIVHDSLLFISHSDMDDEGDCFARFRNSPNSSKVFKLLSYSCDGYGFGLPGHSLQVFSDGTFYYKGWVHVKDTVFRTGKIGGIYLNRLIYLVSLCPWEKFLPHYATPQTDGSVNTLSVSFGDSVYYRISDYEDASPEELHRVFNYAGALANMVNSGYFKSVKIPGKHYFDSELILQSCQTDSIKYLKQFFPQCCPLKVTLSGTTLRSESGQALSNVTILVRNRKGLVKKDSSDKSGNYHLFLFSDSVYTIEFSKPYPQQWGENYQYHSTLTIPKTNFVQEIRMNDFTACGNFPTLFFKKGSSEIDEGYAMAGDTNAITLAVFISTLKRNPTMVVEIASHAGIYEQDERNLSFKRADAVYKYLINQGIDKDRLIPKGYGKAKPIYPLKEVAHLKSAKEREEMDKRNRRVVFRVIRTDFDPVRKF